MFQAKMGGFAVRHSTILFLLVALLTLAAPSWLVAQWVQTSLDSEDVRSFAAIGSNLFAGTWEGGVFLSTNNGTSWTPVNTGLTTTNVYALAVNGTNLFAGTYGDGGVYLSTNNGTSWTAVDSGLTNNVVFALAASGTNLFAGTWGGGVFLSTNNGTSWTAVKTGLTTTIVRALAMSGTNLFAGTRGGVFLSTNNGMNWSTASTDLSDTTVWALAVSGMNLSAGTGVAILDQPRRGGGVLVSTNNGTSWSVANNGFPYDSVTQQYPSVICFATDGPNLFAGTGICSPYGCLGGIFLSTNYGTSWTAVYSDSGQSWNGPVNALAVFGTNLSAGTGWGGVWRRPLSEMITSVERVSSDLPTGYSLSQNYPNPFNPSTAIRFSVPQRSFVTLRIFDLLGREVTTLVSEEIDAGPYTTQWNALGMASGVYFYRLQAGEVTETKRLMLLR